MKAKVVYSYIEGGSKSGRSVPVPNMMDRTFKSFNEALKALKPGQVLTLEVTGKGFRQVGIDKNGEGWIQRNYAHDY